MSVREKDRDEKKEKRHKHHRHHGGSDEEEGQKSGVRAERKKYHEEERDDSDEARRRIERERIFQLQEIERRSGREKKYYADDDAEERYRTVKKAYHSDSEPEYERDPRRKAAKGHYDSDSDEADSDSRHAVNKYEPDRERDRHSPPRAHNVPGAFPTAHTQHDSIPGAFPSSTTARYDGDPASHSNYAKPDRYEHARPKDLGRQMSQEYKRADAWEDHPEHVPRGGYVPTSQYPYTAPGQYAHAESRSREKEHEGERGLHMGAEGRFSVGFDHTHGPQYSQPPVSRPQYVQPTTSGYGQTSTHAYAPQYADHSGHNRTHSTSSPPKHQHQYADPARYEYAQPDPNVRYSAKNDAKPYVANHEPQYPPTKQYSYDHESKYSTHGRHPSEPHVVEIIPGGGKKPQDERIAGRMHSLSVSGGTGLTVATPGGHHGRHNSMSGGLPPGSPLLEAYHGTYQSISPMPSPMMHASHKNHNDDLSDIEPLSPAHSDDSHDSYARTRPARKRVTFYDPVPDAKHLAATLNDRHPETQPLIDILPRLNEDDILTLRTEYKKYAKLGGKGINIAKHIKLKYPSTLGKAAYATALGRWESEAFWANTWYQSNNSRRELLIESLIGRSNEDISRIKKSFSDKRYGDDLVKCMKAELKADKFRVAVLTALEGNRMEEDERVSKGLVEKDVRDLYRALTAKEGGETDMLKIVLVRSDNHLREVMRTFEETYRKNFARSMIEKSQNLVVSSHYRHLPMSLLFFPPQFLLHLSQTPHKRPRTTTNLPNRAKP